MSLEPIKIRRKNNFNLLKEARKLGSFDEFPMLRSDVDPQFHASRNTVDQPFYLRGEKDMVLVQYSGASRVVFESGPVRYFDLGMADFVYVPAGYVHRVLTVEPGIMVRYKAVNPGEEAVSWLCSGCGKELFSHGFDATAQPAQAGYQAGCEAFNALESRACPSCGAEHPEVDLSEFRWDRVAYTLESQEEEEIEPESAHAH